MRSLHMNRILTICLAMLTVLATATWAQVERVEDLIYHRHDIQAAKHSTTLRKTPMHTQYNADNLWNVPVSEFPSRLKIYWDIVAHAQISSKPLNILEIGVFRAGLLRNLRTRTDIEVESYTGVDPYVADATDSYTGSYWKNKNEIFSESGRGTRPGYSTCHHSEF